jgi:hypothetical protein
VRRILTGLLVGLLVAIGSRSAAAQIKGAALLRIPDSAMVQIVRLADGSTLVGRFVDVIGDPVRFETAGGTVTIRRADLREIREARRRGNRAARYWTEDPNPSRLFFGPTARVLPARAVDFSSTYLFLVSASTGIGGVAQVGGGFSVLPLDDFSDNVFFTSAKVAIPAGRSAQFAVGGIGGWAGGFDEEIGGAGFGAVYGVGTFGSRDHALTTGLVVPFGEVESKPIFLLGGEARLGSRLKLVSENYFAIDDNRYEIAGTTHGSRRVVGILGYGVRIFGEKIAVDLAFLNSTADGVFPGVPYVDFVVRF